MKKISLIFLLCCSLSGIACADDASDQVYGDTDTSATSKLSAPEHFAMLDRQVANLNQQNDTARKQDDQTQIADLKGRLEVLEHQYQTLSDQAKEQYKDLDLRIQALTQGKGSTVQEQSSTLASNEQAIESPAQAKALDPASSKGEEAAYQKAFALLKAKDYPRAIPKFENFLSKYPNGSYAPNAHFWLGEVYLLQGQPDMAVTEYGKVIADFPQSDKVQMAQLKLAFSYQDQGNNAKARAQYQKVIKLYPNTTAAKLAQQKLAQLMPHANKKAS